MKCSLIFFCMFTLLFTMSISGQVKTKETRTTTDSTGKTVVTSAEIISVSEDITPRSSMIVINPLKFFLFYNISYFTRVSESTAVGAGVQFPTLSGIDGFGINAETRIYPKGKTLRGFYVAPNISYNSFSKGGSTFSIGVLLGWQWFPGDDFAMGLGIGIDRYFLSGGNGYLGDYEGTLPAVRFDIGYAW